MAEYLTVDDRVLDSTGSGGIEGLGLRMVGGIQVNIDYNNPRMVIEYLTIDA